MRHLTAQVGLVPFVPLVMMLLIPNKGRAGMTTLRRRLLVMVCVTVAVLAMAVPAGARSARIRTSAHSSGGSATAPRTVGAASAVLYDQNNNDAGNDITSQNFQAALDFSTTRPRTTSPSRRARSGASTRSP
jgi:hypothetical protein